VSSGAVKKSIKEIQKIFKLRNCNDSTFSNRSRPCIEFQMKRCSAPCVEKIGKIDYFEDLESAKLYLSSSDSKTIGRLKDDIKKASNDLDFEKAADIRDRLKRIELIREEQSVVTIARDIDIFSMHSENNYVGISIIVVRKGKIRGTKTHLVKKAFFESIDSVYQMAIINFYDSQLDIPKKVLCTHLLESKELICKVLKKKFNANVQITHSPSKSIRPIYNLCKLNAKQIIENHLSRSDKYNFAFDELKNYIGQKKDIKKIEAYDVSHISGSHAVASCVIYTNEGPSKKEYRTFNISKELSGNDVGSLEHVIQRRIKYYDNEETKPDLILIDGGKNQLNFSHAVIQNSGHKDIKVISIVKGVNRIRATETVLSKDGIIEFNKDSKGYLLLQEIRDESHRFAIDAQRRKKNAKNKKSQLDTIDGIGEVLKKRLLINFKSIKNIKSANSEDLMTVKGINAKIAKVIKEKL
jgi:excinuclease ABC subunit C